MPGLYRFAAASDHWLARLMRVTYRGVRNFSLPAPRPIVRPAVAIFYATRAAIFFLRRVVIAEPCFKAQCASYGRNLHTGIHIPIVQGNGDIILGDNFSVDGKLAVFFATRYSDRPKFIVGDNTGFGHGCAFTVGAEIRIGKHCRFGGLISVFDAPGHPADPEARRAGRPSAIEDVRPIIIGDDVWVGSHTIIYPGVTIGDNAIVAMGSVVMSNVAPNTMVGGNPARMIRSLAPAQPAVKAGA